MFLTATRPTSHN